MVARCQLLLLLVLLLLWLVVVMLLMVVVQRVGVPRPAWSLERVGHNAMAASLCG